MFPDAVEDVDEDEEEGDQKPHPARHHLGLDQEADPAGHHEHEARQVHLEINDIEMFCSVFSKTSFPHLHQELHLLPLQPDLDATRGVRAAREVDLQHNLRTLVGLLPAEDLLELGGQPLDAEEVLQRALAVPVVDVVRHAGHRLVRVVV